MNLLHSVLDLVACLGMGVIACVLIWRAGRDLGDDDNTEDYVDKEDNDGI